MAQAVLGCVAKCRRQFELIEPPLDRHRALLHAGICLIILFHGIHVPQIYFGCFGIQVRTFL
jgi:hypothetical protein